ncbi:M1 family metallopeptidase [Sediminibacterium soli]|uniref:M1 family metallopeptidase n=1 Tax=Sediminibacterium soli TaxID=2698829 RepID=UPI00137AC408|nr:M1 family metallopeptidase [Sediminibacterium soli]NCI48279.1 M1 family peptidase [Sediminibacterium soli]
MQIQSMFSKLLFMLLVLVNTVSAQQALYNPSIDIVHYRFDLAVSDSNDVLKGNTRVVFHVNTQMDTLYLDLIGAGKNGKGMTVHSVMQDSQALPFVHRNDSLLVGLQANAGENKTIAITYSGIPGDGLIFSRNKAGQRTIFGDNWPNRARNWLPCKDHLSDKATVEFIVTAPGHYKIVANGSLQEEKALPNGLKRTHWKESVPIPTKVMVIGAADFAVSDAVRVGHIPVTSWIFPQQRQAGFTDYAPAADILSYFIRKIGPYAYSKLANVQSKTIFGGMENAGAIFYAESSVTGKNRATGLLAHEIAHQWFGDAATEKDWPHIWLSEGFATEMSQLYLEHLYGADTMRAMLKTSRKQIIAFTRKQQVPVVDTTKGRDIMKLLNTNSYQKGGWVLHMLRTDLGDELFWKCVQAYYAAFCNKNASSADLQAVFEKVSGKNLSAFFHQWLYVPENPALNLSWKYDETQNEVIIRIEQRTAYTFHINLDLELTDGKGRSMVKTIPVVEKSVEQRFSMEEKPVRLEWDPGCKLLFEEIRL